MSPVELSTSRLPISEALQRLKSEALIETISRVGTRVKTPSAQDIRGFYVVREALESQAARLFALQATRADRAEPTASQGASMRLMGTAPDGQTHPGSSYMICGTCT